MTYTRTRTFYFGEDEVAPLLAAAKDLDRSYREREPHISAEASEAMRARLEMLAWTIALLKEPAPE